MAAYGIMGCIWTRYDRRVWRGFAAGSNWTRSLWKSECFNYLWIIWSGSIWKSFPWFSCLLTTSGHMSLSFTWPTFILCTKISDKELMRAKMHVWYLNNWYFGTDIWWTHQFIIFFCWIYILLCCCVNVLRSCIAIHVGSILYGTMIVFKRVLGNCAAVTD